MSILARIEDEVIGPNEFVRFLKLNGKLDQLLEDIVTDRLTVHIAKKQNISVSTEDVQHKFDDIRRVYGLHRAQATREFLERLGVSLDEFEEYITDQLCREKLLESVTSDSAVKEYFNLHSPEFDTIEVAHIVMDSEGKAREIVALLQEEPDMFHDLAKEHSLDFETREKGGMIGTVLRGSLESDIEAKIFNAEINTILGPFASLDERFYEVFKVTDKHSASLDESTADQVRKKLYDTWLEEKAGDCRIEIM